MRFWVEHKKVLDVEQFAFEIPRAQVERIADVVEGSILDNIDRQIKVTGAPLKTNAPSTMARKRRAGMALKSLVAEEHRFVRGRGQSWARKTVAGLNWSVTITPATPELRNLVRYVQQMGYRGWFGVGARGLAAARTLIRRWFDQRILAARRAMRGF